MSQAPAPHTSGLRETLRLANAENACTIASQLGSRIAQITLQTQDDPSVRHAVVEVRKTGIDLLEALSRRQNEGAAREAAFAALDTLEVELARLSELGRANEETAARLGPAVRT